MTNWDITTPLGTESKSQGDDRIRELKAAIQEALRGQQATGVEAVFPGSDVDLPVYRPRFPKGTTGARPTAGQYGLYINETLNTIQRDNGVSWVDVATLIPSGTVMVFYQAAAPVGWTKVTTQDDKALRVVSGSGGGAGGTHLISAGVSHSHTVDSHTHDLSSHTHSTPAHTHTLADSTGGNPDDQTDSGTEIIKAAGGQLSTGTGSAGALKVASYTTDSGGSGTSGAPSNNSSGAATPGTNTQAPVIAYIDVLICSKD